MPFVHFTKKHMTAIMATITNDMAEASMKRDKKRVEGVQWSEDQLRVYLDFNTYDGTDRDFHCLYRAYTRMDAFAFEDFVAIFKAEGRNLQATNLEGLTVASILRNHANGENYSELLS